MRFSANLRKSGRQKTWIIKMVKKVFFFKKNKICGKLQKTANFAAAKKHNDSYNTGVRKPYKLEKCVGRANSSSQKKNYTI